jgi:hypothetical protein
LQLENRSALNPTLPGDGWVSHKGDLAGGASDGEETP